MERQAELERLQIMKDLEMAQAKVNAFRKLQREENSLPDQRHRPSLPDIDKEWFIENYVRNHCVASGSELYKLGSSFVW